MLTESIHASGPIPLSDRATRDGFAVQASASFGASAYTEQLVSDSHFADQSARKPRVLATSPRALIHHEEVEAPVSSQQQTAPEVPRSQFARIRALVKYGMKPPQVAEVYGVAIGAIEAILRKA